MQAVRAEREGALTVGTVGFVGLGNMGSVLAANLVGTGHAVVAHDALGPERAPTSASYVSSVSDVARRAPVIVLSLPDGAASEQVVREVLTVTDRCTTHVVDTSTIGVRAGPGRWRAARRTRGVLHRRAGVRRGGGRPRATLAVMYAAADDACAHVEPVLAGLSDRRHRVGDRPGMAQAMKLANNFLSATTLAATSEAVAFGMSEGLDMATMLEVLNTASGRSAATSDKFPDHVLTGRYDAGFTNSLMAKDVRLYLHAVEERWWSGVAWCGDRVRVGAVRDGGARCRFHPHLSLRRGS